MKNVDKKKVSASENRYYKCKTNFNLNNYLSELQEALTSLFGYEDDVLFLIRDNLDVLFDRFLRAIKNTIYLHAALKQYSRKQRRLRQKPWITKSILRSENTKTLFFSLC